MSHTLAVVLRDARRASVKHRWAQCIGARSRKLVRDAGQPTESSPALVQTVEHQRLGTF